MQQKRMHVFSEISAEKRSHKYFRLPNSFKDLAGSKDLLPLSSSGTEPTLINSADTST
jgi:hypothetical protein